MINRRQFLCIAGAVGTGLVTGGLGSLLNVQLAAAQTKPNEKFIADLDIALKATPGQVPIFPGNTTGVWQYQAQVLEGEGSSLVHLERSYLGPIIRVRTTALTSCWVQASELSCGSTSADMRWERKPRW